jgi:anaerobic carbon-monoxide dehydrogenase catalytic subunit
MGSCVDNTRILTVLTQMVEEGGLGDDIEQVPAVGLAPEWMSEKALCHWDLLRRLWRLRDLRRFFACQWHARPGFEDSDIVLRYISAGWEKLYGGKLEFIADRQEMIEKTLEHIDKKRAALGLPEYDPQRFGRSGDARMLELEGLPLEERRAAMYGVAAD